MRKISAMVAAFALAVGLTACGPGEVQISSSASLYPIFQSAVTDYVNRCDPTQPTTLDLTVPDDKTVSINGAPPRTGTFSVQVDQEVGQRFTIAVTTDGATTTHHVRCLPTDFPAWRAERRGAPQAEYYATQLIEFDAIGGYSAIFDTNGVPVWWLPPQPSLLFTPLSNGNFATMDYRTGGGGMSEFNLAGERVQNVNTVGGPSDFHDVLLLPNGNYVMATVQEQPCLLTSWGLSDPQTCLNHVFQELTPAGVPVWQWDTSTHIPVSETTADWREQQFADTSSPDVYDPWHYNSVEDTGDGFIISFRHLDAVYKIDKLTGAIVWKLGGTDRPESLRIVDDPLNGFSGQHDARLLDDGTVALYDNGTLGLGPTRTPRSIGYAVDAENGTATLVVDVRDPIAPTSGCCGSTRVLPGGSHVTGWGQTAHMTENRADGTRVFQLSVHSFIYRALPLLPGQYTASQFRTGMDAQYAD